MPPVSPALRLPAPHPGYRDNAPQRPRGGPAIVLSLTSLGGAEGLPGRARLRKATRATGPPGEVRTCPFPPRRGGASGFPARGGIALPGAPWTPSDARPRTSRRREVRGKSSNNKLWNSRQDLVKSSLSLTLHSAPSARLTSPRSVIAPAGRRPNTFPRGRLRERTF